MKPLSELPKSDLKNIKALLFDLDGTFVNRDYLHGTSYLALERIYKLGIKTVAVTGRPAGWCDMMVRWWPVNSVIGENGAIHYFIEDGKVIRETFHNSSKLAHNQELLANLFEEIKSEFGPVNLASDQLFRNWDLAIDISEEAELSFSKVNNIFDFCIKKGANAAISNIHLNVWYGKYNKVVMALKILENYGINKSECIYVGDSPNDEPIFKIFPLSVGVKSVEKYSNIMKNRPMYITEGDEGEGFEELVTAILSTR